MTAIACAGLGVRFSATRVLGGVDLTVGADERVALTGPNGAGKTTLLRVLAGLLRPDEGDVRIFGGSPTDPRVKACVGHLGHAPHLYPRLSARENVRFWAGMHGVRTSGDELLEHLGVDPSDRRPASAYSQGMRRRIGLACVLAARPELLLVDEPFAGLDASGADIVTSLLAEGTTTLVLATHESERAREICTRTLTLEEGRLQEVAPAP